MKDYVQSSFKLQINIRLDQHLHTITPIVLWLPSKLDIHINMFARITPLIIYLQIIVLVVLLNYYFNPTILTSHCLAAHAQSPTLGSGTIIDCSACANLDSRDIIESRLTGDIHVLLPLLSSDVSIDKGRLPVDSKQSPGSGALEEAAMIEGLAFVQTGCLEYDCRSWLILNDFALSETEHRNKLQMLGMDLLKDLKFFQDHSLVMSMLAAKPKTGKYKRISSTFISNATICSIMLRFRYNPVAELDPETQPIFALHQITDNILIRLLLIAPLIYDFIRLAGFLRVHNVPYPTFFTAVLSLSFICQKMGIIGSFLALCVMGNVMGSQRVVFIVLGIGLLMVRMGQESGVLPMLLSPLLIMLINGFVACFWRGKNSKVEVYQLVFINTLHALIAGIYNWQFLVGVCPLLLVFGLSHLPGDVEERSQQYRRSQFNQIEEEEDVLMKIDRALEKH